MLLLKFLFARSSTMVVLAVLTGMLSGAGSATLMALMNLVLSRPAIHTNMMAAVFVGATLTVLFANLGSRLLLLRISGNAVLEMRVNLCTRILTTPLWRVETHGTGALIVTLTEDILAVSDTLAEFPLLCIHAAIICACLTYLFWLSWLLALLFLVVFAVGVLIHS
jgi:putative ATP-binding cassette transporter